MHPRPDFPFVRSVLHVEEVDSTSDLARRILDDGPLDLPTLVWADRQTRGRGQRANSWWSDSGSLTATVILDPSSIGLSIPQQSRVALAVAAAVALSIAARYPACRPGIRWPNDIEVGGRKLGGILPERVESPVGPRLLIGIGLNVATRLEDAPSEVRRMASTIVAPDEGLLGGDRIAPLLVEILGRLGDALAALAGIGEGQARAWNRLDTLAGSTIRVEAGSERIEGVADGFEDSGGLRIIHEGRLRVIHAGRVVRD